MLILPGAERMPSVRVHVNPLYALYHFLVSEGQRPRNERNPATLEAAGNAAKARHLLGVHGIWDIWEHPLAQSKTTDEAVAGLTRLVTETVTELGSALNDAETEFLERLWPERQEIIDASVATLKHHLHSRWAHMAEQQAAQLGVTWPQHVDAYLVTDCYDWQGGYSHPLTIDVTNHTGLTLCETLLHEATHVADVYTGEAGKESLRDRLTTYLVGAGVPHPTAWSVWHAVIFATSARQVRMFIEPAYSDYGVTHGLYQWFKVPGLPSLWDEWMTGERDEAGFLQAIADEVIANPG